MMAVMRKWLFVGESLSWSRMRAADALEGSGLSAGPSICLASCCSGLTGSGLLLVPCQKTTRLLVVM